MPKKCFNENNQRSIKSESKWDWWVARNPQNENQCKSHVNSNIDLQDGLVNGQLGTVMHIARNSRGILKIYLKFDDTRAGVKAMNVDIIKLRKKLITSH